MKIEIVKFLYFPYKLVAYRFAVLSPIPYSRQTTTHFVLHFPFTIYLSILRHNKYTLIENGFVKNPYMPILFGFRCRMRSFLCIFQHNPRVVPTSLRHTFQIQRILCQVDTYKKRNRWGFPTYTLKIVCITLENIEKSKHSVAATFKA